jgi:DNA-binding beta-propeller fold protein YncE
VSDFLTDLRGELVDAHERYGRRGRAGRSLRGLHPRGWRWRDALAPAAALALLAFALVATGLLKGPDRSASLRIATVVRIGGQPRDAVSGFGSLWVSDYENRLVRIDPANGRVIQSIPLSGAATSVAVDPQGVSVATEGSASRSGRLQFVDRSGRLGRQVGLRGFSAVLAGAPAGTWAMASTHGSDSLWSFDRTTGKTRAWVRIPSPGVSIAATPAAMWDLDAQGRVSLRDPGSGRLVRDLGLIGLLAPDQPTDNLLAADATGAWVFGADGRSVLRLEGGRIVQRIGVSFIGIPVLAVQGDTLWVASGDPLRGGSRLQRIDAGSGEVTGTVDLRGHQPRALVPLRDGLAVIASDGALLLVR